LCSLQDTGALAKHPFHYSGTGNRTLTTTWQR
jgi:hypothetical protein